jgi:hypothetical protein
MLERADIAQLLIFRQGKFFQENFRRRSTFNNSAPEALSTTCHARLLANAFGVVLTKEELTTLKCSAAGKC